jgi:hypothetical protein
LSILWAYRQLPHRLPQQAKLLTESSTGPTADEVQPDSPTFGGGKISIKRFRYQTCGMIAL